MPTLHFRRVERRRTTRVSMFIDLLVQSCSDARVEFFQNARTESVSGHGGSMILGLDVPVRVGQTLRVTNQCTRESVACKVVSVRPARDRQIRVSFEFAESASNFWKMSFPSVGIRAAHRSAVAAASPPSANLRAG